MFHVRIIVEFSILSQSEFISSLSHRLCLESMKNLCSPLMRIRFIVVFHMSSNLKFIQILCHSLVSFRIGSFDDWANVQIFPMTDGANSPWW